jgi:hypothetical protein
MPQLTPLEINLIQLVIELVTKVALQVQQASAASDAGKQQVLADLQKSLNDLAAQVQAIKL